MQTKCNVNFYIDTILKKLPETTINYPDVALEKRSRSESTVFLPDRSLMKGFINCG